MLRCISSCSGFADWTVRWFCSPEGDRHERFRACGATSWSSRTPLVGTSAFPSGRRPFTKHKAPKPKTKQSHRIVCAMAKKKCKSRWEGICAQRAEIFGRRLRRGRGGNAEGAWNTILSGFVVTAGVTTKPDAAVASRARSDGKSARRSARSGCAAQCAREEQVVRAPTPSRARYGAQHQRQARADALTLDASA